MKTYIQILLFLIILIGLSCREEPTEPPDGNIQLTAEYIRVTDAILRVKASFTHGPWTLHLNRDGRNVFQTQPINLISIDTLILDDNLLPKQNYTYKAYYYIGGTPVDSSEVLHVTTMDTTSHDITWEFYSLGYDMMTWINDVAIVNDTCVWVVGEIYLLDSLGQVDNTPHGAAKWDGHNWEFMKVPYHDYGSTTLRPGKLNAIHAFGSNDIYVASSANLLHWDGYEWKERAFFMTEFPFYGQVNTIWGTSGSNLYCGGRKGAIYYVNDSMWQKLQSGTEINISDMYGATDIKTGKIEILALASDISNTTERIILKIDGTNVMTMSDSGISYTSSGIWFIPGNVYYVVGTYIYNKKYKGLASEYWNRDLGSWESEYYKREIRGNGINDVIVGCQVGDLLHFNGAYWVRYPLNVGYFSHHVAIRGNTIVTAGDNQVAIGKK